MPSAAPSNGAQSKNIRLLAHHDMGGFGKCGEGPRRLGAQHGVMARGRGSLADATGAGAAARGRKGALEFLSANAYRPSLLNRLASDVDSA